MPSISNVMPSSSNGWFSSMWNPAYAYVMLFLAMTLVLMVRPHGLLGTPGRE